MFNAWSKSSAVRRRGRAVLTRSRRAAAITAATMMLAATGVVGVVASAGPAAADEPGLWCTIAGRGSITASPSPAQYGQFVTVQWSTQTDYCPSPVVYVTGPGFSGQSVSLGGSRQVRAVTDGSTITWTLYLMDLEVDSPTPVQMASTTITVQ